MTASPLGAREDWHTPKIDISIITNDRPHSLSRLLTSLSRARYFGDKLTLRVNAEQTADKGTLQLVQNIQWNHGAVFLHHRVVRGGLLPAVVESWYPLSNDTYGLLLEDDVEVSPLFYAWLKMSLLRYRFEFFSAHTLLKLTCHVLFKLWTRDQQSTLPVRNQLVSTKKC